MQSFTVSTTEFKTFREKLVRWYKAHGRDLPWRHTREPYRILIAEVMLQQTQVVTVIERYQRWLKRFPTIHSLAKAKPADVLKEWAGLGYNRRALALHQLANQIVNEYGGRFPSEPEALQRFKGIGEYTAHAIASFAFEQRVPLVDTNIKRVLGRVFLGYRKLNELRDESGMFWELSRQLVEPTRSSYTVNQSLMDFGATICVAKKPKCEQCPMQKLCKSYPEILTADPEHLRVKTKRTEPKFFGQPRRIWRGKILQYLNAHPKRKASLVEIGKAIQPNWQSSRLPWLSTVIETLKKDKLVTIKKGVVVAGH